jgi:hypothetical protein
VDREAMPGTTYPWVVASALDGATRWAGASRDEVSDSVRVFLPCRSSLLRRDEGFQGFPFGGGLLADLR